MSSKLNRASALGMVQCALCIALLPGCSSRPADDADGAIVVAIPNGPNSFDPRIGVDDISARVAQMVYTPLMTVDATLHIVPALAMSLENPDPLTYIVRLRHGVRFHDGHELTSRDVVYTFGSFLDPAFISPRKGAYRVLESVRALDDYTVQFRLKEPFGSFANQLAMPVVPEGAGDSLLTFPIGTGPYRFVRYAVDDEVVLSAFEGYYDGLPQNTGVILKVVPDDTMRGLELRKRSVDVVINDLAPDIAYQLERDGDVRVTQSPGVDYAYVAFNMRDPMLMDKRVRHAIGYAIDRQAIVDYLRRGMATPAVGILSPVVWAFEPDVRQFNHDPALARRLLDEAGYPDPDGDGPQTRLSLTMKISNNEFTRLQSTVIQQQLGDVGINVDLRSYEFATLFADVLKGNFQMTSLQWVGVNDPDMLRRVFHSQQVPPSGFNRGYYSNPDVDRLIDLATRATDTVERRHYYSGAQKLIADDAPYISLWYKTNIAVTQPTIGGLRLNAMADFTALKDVRKGANP